MSVKIGVSLREHLAMDEQSQSERGSSKLTGIRQIVRLKGFLQKWQSVTIGNSKPKPNNKPHRRRRSNTGISPDISKRLKSNKNCDSDEESCHGPAPADVPKGYLAVYVGPELRRFIIPTTYLSHSLFKVLLEKVEEEFGFDHNGGLTIPCEIEIFKFLLNYMENHPKDDHHDRKAEAILSH
ncbi:protein SMALL AUXIN UP-REGULATED RNA 54-like [Euphorbia lathyris]|uniref:protein SMALL AUXIN UP-REGULATED RNA 54-like n=1 Tax=Euphorbia lathyris TaxID=212925 RepID=UPI0033142A2C